MIRVSCILFLLSACGGEISTPEPAPDLESAAPAPIESSTPDAAQDEPAPACGWQCVPAMGTTLYEDTCTGRYCPGTGGCASHNVPNPCADGGT